MCYVWGSIPINALKLFLNTRGCCPLSTSTAHAFRLEKTSRSSSFTFRISILSGRIKHWVPHPDVSWTPPGMGIQHLPGQHLAMLGSPFHEENLKLNLPWQSLHLSESAVAIRPSYSDVQCEPPLAQLAPFWIRSCSQTIIFNCHWQTSPPLIPLFPILNRLQFYYVLLLANKSLLESDFPSQPFLSRGDTRDFLDSFSKIYW